MKNKCIFCGENIVSKTMEHVIPQWLINSTGDPNRTVSVGIDWNTGESRKYSFSAFKFPACHSCNNNFSSIEALAREVILKILHEDAVPSESFSLLLSWFDKVRIGVWLGFLLLNTNPLNIIPNFYIYKRIDIADRMLLIYKGDDKTKGINLVGVGTPFYNISPICFGLRINQFCFINLSTDFLFSRRLGLPYPIKKILVNRQGEVRLRMVEGMQRMLTPLIRKNYDISCTEIYQPIIRPEFLHSSIYNNDYVRNYFDVPHSHLGKILINYKNRITEYSSVSEKQWLPENTHRQKELVTLAVREVLSFQEWLLDDMPSCDDLDLETKEDFKGYKQWIKRFNKTMFERIERGEF